MHWEEQGVAVSIMAEKEQRQWMGLRPPEMNFQESKSPCC